jgi:hypothetical protein
MAEKERPWWHVKDKLTSTEQFEVCVRAFLSKPTEKNWHLLAHRLIPDTGRTVWQAWIRVDGAAPLQLPATLNWPSIPAPFTVRRPIREARKGKVPVGWWWFNEPRPPRVP